MMRRVVFGFLGLLMIHPVSAEGLGPVVAKDGSWEFHKQKDSFSDKPSCVITQIKKPYIQVSLGGLYLNLRGRGGVSGYEYRIDESPSGGLRLPTRTEESTSIIQIKGSEFGDFMRSSRFRIQILTLVSGIQNEDLVTKGLTKLYNRMVDECPE